MGAGITNKRASLAIHAAALIFTGCAGPAGVAPQSGRVVSVRTCDITEATLNISDAVIVDAASCPQLSMSGIPLVISEGKSLRIKNAGDINIAGNVRILGSFSAESVGKIVHFKGLNTSAYEISVLGDFSTTKIGFSGAGSIIFGTESQPPKSVQMSDATIVADESAAPVLTMYGNANDCTDKPSISSYNFSNMTITSLKDQTINLFQMPENLSGIAFNPETPEQPFKASLGALCIAKSKALKLDNPNLSYHAESVQVFGSLILTAANLVVTSTDPIIVDGGTLVSEGGVNGKNALTLNGSGSIANQRIIAQNNASVVLKQTVLQNAAITSLNSNITIDNATIVSPCKENPKTNECKTPEQKAPLIISDGSTADLNKAEFEPKNDVQIYVADNGERKSHAITTGDPGDFKVSSANGHRFFMGRRLSIAKGVPISKKIAGELLKLNGTFEGPCLRTKGDAINTFRRSFTFINEIEERPSQSPNIDVNVFIPTKLRVLRSIINYEDNDCQIAGYTGDLGGDAHYYIRQEDDGNITGETLLNEIYYDFNQMIWNYHNPNIIGSFNEQKVCGIGNWEVNVAQDVTQRICYGTKIYFKGFYDRFDLFDGRNLHLSLDYDDRPDELQDLVPLNVNRSIDFMKRD